MREGKQSNVWTDSNTCTHTHTHTHPSTTPTFYRQKANKLIHTQTNKNKNNHKDRRTDGQVNDFYLLS